MRVQRKVKIDGRWILAPVLPDAKGRPDAKHVSYKGKLVPVQGGTFYLCSGRGDSRKAVACGDDPEAVRRAMKTQAQVIELRGCGMDVGDAPEIVGSRRKPGNTLRDMARDFKAEPPTAFAEKTVKKYDNAFRTFSDWAASVNVFACEDVKKQTITRWIAYLQKNGLDASTIVPKVRIVLAELKLRGNEITLDARTLPKVTHRERDIYTDDELDAIFRACDVAEYELFQTFLLTGMRYREVAFLGWADIDPQRRTVRVSRKRDLGFVPKAYHERTIPVPALLIDMLQRRAAFETKSRVCSRFSSALDSACTRFASSACSHPRT